MYRKFRFVIIISLALIIVGIIFPLSAIANHTVSADHEYLPYLSATITTPANGSSIQVGNCFTVQAVISLSCPSTGLNNDWFIKPVYALPAGVTSAGATITINGNAVLSGGQSSLISIGNLACNGQATVSWGVCCTGKGLTTITVTPSGSYNLVKAPEQPNPLNIVKPVFATASGPLPADHITSATITVSQLESPLRNDNAQPAGSGPQSQTWAQPADNRITTAFVQQDQVLSGEPVRIMANVSNKGDLPGSYTATLTVNNQIEATRKVTVPGGASIPIEFTVTKSEPGNYEADINGKKVYFTVTGKQTGSPIDFKIIAAIVIGILLLTSLILLIRRLSTR
jgi:hypothetical protein